MKKTVLDYALKIRVPITLFVVLSSILITYFISRPEREGVGYGPEQPIKYSHRLHAGTMGIDCKYCHVGADKTRHAVVPSANICMNCHTVARKDSPEIKKLTFYYKNNIPIKWVRIHRLPEFVYFNHSAHVNKKIDCAVCHGNVRYMETMTQVKSFTMSACLDCHRNPQKMLGNMTNISKAPDNCWTCHR